MEAYSPRKYVIMVGFSVCFLLLVVRLGSLQFNKEYTTTASRNVFRYQTIYPSRGLIYDRNGQIIVGNQTAYDIVVTPSELEVFDTLDLCRIFDLTAEDVKNRLDQILTDKRNARNQSVTFLRQVPNDQYARYLERAEKFPGFAGQSHNVRYFPTNLNGNLIGYILEADKNFLEKNPEYRQGDYIGKTGLEEAYEPFLRGQNGYSIFLRDVHNRIKEPYNNGANDVQAVPGKNLTTTIDARLQLLGESLMKNKVGAVVALEPATGEVLSLITSPGLPAEYLNNLGRYYGQLIADPLRPMYNRAIMSSYPPGSPFKLANGLAGLQEGVLTPNMRYPCSSGYHVGRGVGCHVHPSPLDMEQSIMMSCNAYYCYVLRNILDNKKYETIGDAFAQWRSYQLGLGFGAKLGIDLPGELAGNLPTAATYDRIHGKNRWKSLTVISLSIGQGEIGVTPLQLANLASIIANRGHFYTPHMVRSISDTTFSPSVTRHDVPIDKEHFTPLVNGMYRAVNSPANSGATASIVNVPGLEICGKTGTAQNPSKHDNSVFICFAPKDDPKIAIAVYIERGGFGATWAAPIASLMVEQYLNGAIADTPQRQELLQHMLEGNLLDRHLQTAR